MIEFIPWAALIVALTAGAYVVRIALAFGKIEQTARLAKDQADNFTVGLSALSAAHNMFQVQVAREYVNRDVMREFEERLRHDIRELGERVDRLAERTWAGPAR
jgi:hypothetical protein